MLLLGCTLNKLYLALLLHLYQIIVKLKWSPKFGSKSPSISVHITFSLTSFVTLYRSWFVDAASLILEKMQENSCVIFYQSDVKLLDKTNTHCVEWLDKAHLCSMFLKFFVFDLCAYFAFSAFEYIIIGGNYTFVVTWPCVTD